MRRLFVTWVVPKKRTGDGINKSQGFSNSPFPALLVGLKRALSHSLVVQHHYPRRPPPSEPLPRTTLLPTRVSCSGIPKRHNRLGQLCMSCSIDGTDREDRVYIHRSRASRASTKHRRSVVISVQQGPWYPDQPLSHPRRP